MIKACPRCGDSSKGYTIKDHGATLVYTSVWGEEREWADTEHERPPPVNARCNNCSKLVPVKIAEGLADA